MKMDNCLLTLVFGLSVLSVLSDSKDQCDEYAEEGQNFTVPLNHKLQDSETLKWRRNDTIIFYRKGEQIITKPPERVQVYQNGSLKLTNLKKADTGRYTPEVHYASGQAIPGFESIKLCILDSFPEPKVEIKCSKTSPTKVTFTCKVDKAEGLTFKWFKNKNNVVTEEKKDKPHILTQTAEKVEGNSFECKVSNLASSKTSNAVQHECTRASLDFWIMVGILGGEGGLVLLLIIIVIVCCVRPRKKRSMKVKDEEELRLGRTNSEQQQQQQHHHKHNHPPGQHHHHHQQQPVGHTGPRQHRHKQHRDPRSKVPDIPNGQPEPSPRGASQVPRPADNVDDN